IAFDVLAGQPPYEKSNLTSLLVQGLNQPIDTLRLPVNDALKLAFGKLLSFDPAQRYSHAGQVVADLQAAIGRPVDVEDVAQRESYLEAARFVGREQELGDLRAALLQAKEGKGSGWLITGESGVGKSRMMDELRTSALVEGMLAVRGQLQPEGNQLYDLWRDVLRHLVLQTYVTLNEASTLLPLIPDIERLIGFEVPKPERLEPEENQRRLFEVIERVFSRQRAPVLILLEDLQWLDEGMTLLQRIASRLINLPVVLVASYRDDERSDLPEHLPEMRVIRLKRHSQAEVEELSVSILGEEIGQRPDIVDWLMRETEGNVLFVIEVLRALAERFGRLDQIGEQRLPAHMMTGGINQLLKERINQMPRWALQPLIQAAVCGRMLDLRLMAALAPDLNLERWLSLCMDHAILTVKDGDIWEFVHDKIREYILFSLGDADRQALHLAAARAIETSYREDPHAKSVVLAYHYEQAGELMRAIEYLSIAAENALHNYANHEAIGYFERSLSLAKRVLRRDRLAANPLNEAWHARIERRLGDAYLEVSDFEQAQAAFERVVAHYQEVLAADLTAEIPMDQSYSTAYAYERLVDIYLRAGRWDAAQDAVDQSAALYLRMSRLEGEYTRRLDDWVRAVMSQGWLHYYQGDFAAARDALAERVDFGRRRHLNYLVSGLAGVGFAHLRLGSHEDGQQALRRAHQAVEAAEHADKASQFVAYSLAALAYLRSSHPSEAYDYARQALDLGSSLTKPDIYRMEGLMGLAETFLLLWEEALSDQERHLYKQGSRDAIQLVHRFAQLVPIARPRAWVFQGCYYRLGQREDRAEQALQFALEEAAALHMPYEEGLASYELAMLAHTDGEQRRRYITQAIERFKQLGNNYNLAVARAALIE
ncbi:MAG: AAA family ATPase, partial [Chloroflexi bacterium]|nr:AAA family ATPase [Chloroflexota bacterium]